MSVGVPSRFAVVARLGGMRVLPTGALALPRLSPVVSVGAGAVSSLRRTADRLWFPAVPRPTPKASVRVGRDEMASSGGEPRGREDDLVQQRRDVGPAQARGGCSGVGDIVRNDRELEPGRVRGEASGGQVCERTAFERGDDSLDDRVATVDPVRVDLAQVAVGDERVIPPGVEQRVLLGF